MKIMGHCFGIFTRLDYIFGSFLCILGYFLKVRLQNGGYFLGLVKFKYFLRCLKFLTFFFFGGGGVNGRC